MRTADIGVSLQHPRRSLGNRHRSQAEKFYRLGEKDTTNLSWAEQSARQAVLHDFTHPDNWKILLKIVTVAGFWPRSAKMSFTRSNVYFLLREPDLLVSYFWKILTTI